MKDERTTGRETDTTVEQLLQHLQMMRSAIPVNHELKQALKQQLLAKEQQESLPVQSRPAAGSPKGKTAVRRWALAGWIATALLAAALILIGFLLILNR